jgi:hypothetical protein
MVSINLAWFTQMRALLSTEENQRTSTLFAPNLCRETDHFSTEKELKTTFIFIFQVITVSVMLWYQMNLKNSLNGVEISTR